jgi:hypothetical protein
MIYLTTSSSATITIIPTIDLIGKGDIYMKLKDCITKEIYSLLVSVTRVGDTTTLYTNQLDFQIQDRFYEMSVIINSNSEVVYKDKVFCTNKNLNNFTINQGEYTLPNVGDNSYIVL